MNSKTVTRGIAKQVSVYHAMGMTQFKISLGCSKNRRSDLKLRSAYKEPTSLVVFWAIVTLEVLPPSDV